MTEQELRKLKYPVGEFAPDTALDDQKLHHWIESIGRTPQTLRQAVAGLNQQQLDTPYRPDGWTVRQVVHHLADSHMNAYIRFKLTLTENEPTIKPYDQDRWAELPDSRLGVDVSLNLLDGIHERWVTILRAMSSEDFRRTYFHPEYQKLFRLDVVLQLYDWHGRHHVAHITKLRERMKW